MTLERFQRDWNEKAARCVGRFVRDKQLGVLNHSVLDALPPPRNLLGRPPHQGRNFSKQRSITGQPRCSARQTPGGSGLHVRSVPQIRCSATMRIYLVANHPRRAAKLARNRPDACPSASRAWIIRQSNTVKLVLGLVMKTPYTIRLPGGVRSQT